MYELETDAGTVFSVSEGLAAAMAEMLNAAAAPTEDDLVEAVNVPLCDVLPFRRSA